MSKDFFFDAQRVAKASSETKGYSRNTYHDAHQPCRLCLRHDLHGDGPLKWRHPDGFSWASTRYISNDVVGHLIQA